MNLATNVKSYIVKYYNTYNKDAPKAHRQSIEQTTTIFATNEKEVDIIINFLYPLIYHSDEYKIDGVFVRTKEFEKESNGKFKYLY